jgi:hypothetical protein
MSRLTTKNEFVEVGFRNKKFLGRHRTSLQAIGCSATPVQRCLFIAALLVSIAPLAAQSADDIKPPIGYRNWFHVSTTVVDKTSPLFDTLGGIHNVSVNSAGETALKKGGPYPDESSFVNDVHDFIVSDGTYVEGPRKVLAIMIKDNKKYSSTGGWGFEEWAEGDPTRPLVTNPTKQCFECHEAKKDRDYVYSAFIP